MAKTREIDKLAKLRWILLLLIVFSGFGNLVAGPIALILYLLPTIFVLMHGSRYFGRKNIFIFLSIVLIITYATEYLGVHTGLIFGNYYYSSVNNGILIGGVPPLVLLTYFSIAYGAFWLGRILLGKFGIIRGWLIIGFSLLGGMTMALSDLASDPVNSTVNKVYVWTQGGVFFGVPYQNFLGWLVETFVLFLAISVVLAYWRKSPNLHKIPTKSFQLEPVLLFAAPILAIILRPLWQHQNIEIYSAMSLIALFGAGTLILAAVLRVIMLQQSSN